MELLNKSLLRHWYVDHSLKSVLEATNETLSICPDKECIVCLKNILHVEHACHFRHTFIRLCQACKKCSKCHNYCHAHFCDNCY
jgi:hypothetical protein